jgi:predicted TIM-barrel fold metal-dependent hydrolase
MSSRSAGDPSRVRALWQTDDRVTSVIDSDEHLYEPRTMWADHIDPARRDDALALVDDDLGYTWLSWRGQHLDIADVHHPGAVDDVGAHRERFRRGERSTYDYDESLPATYWDPSARVGWLEAGGLEGAVCFPNFGLLWERRLSDALPALTANMAAWNRWCASIVRDGGGRLHPVAHLTLRDSAWLTAQLAELASVGVRLAMIAPAPVDGRPLSHPDHDALWAAFVEHGITPVFHVADQPRVLDDCWYTEPDAFVPVIESAFLWVPPALAVADLILNGVFDRHPDLRIGIVELSSIWVPQFLLMIDGAFDFTSRLNGRPLVPLQSRPSEYFAQHVRVSSFAYEDPRRLTQRGGDLFMCCSDFPHSEGTATPLADYARAGCEPASADALFRGNVSFLLS